MKKITAIILSALTCAALGITGAAMLGAQNFAAAKAETANENGATAQTSLISPATYEEYLSLSAPSDVAVSEHYTAIADGNVIYIFDREAGIYRKYAHEFNTQDPLKNNVTKLQFYGNRYLYFLDATYLYALDLKTIDEDTVKILETRFNCSTFYLHENTLYYTDVKSTTQLSKLDISELDLENPLLDGNQAITLASNLSGNPTITVYQNELYYTSHLMLYKINLDTNKSSYVAAFPNLSGISSIAIEKDVLVCTDNSPRDENSTARPTFFAYDLTELTASKATDLISPITMDVGGYSALNVYGECVYAVKENSVRCYSIAESQFTSYEICSESDSAHRLNDGTAMTLANGKLLIAENGNHRISVYDVQDETYLPAIPSDLTAAYLSSDGTTVMSATEGEAVLYSLETSDYGTAVFAFDDFNGRVEGVTNVYGKYYFATDNYCHYVAEQTAEGWTLTKIEHLQKRKADLLTSDVYGNLYVTSGAQVYKFTEEEFLSATYETTAPFYENPLLEQASNLLIDYEGSMYALIDGKLQKLGENEPFDLNTPLVYSDSATVRSFAFSIEENVTYLLYGENYLAKTAALQLPTVRSIAVNGVDKSIFANESAEFSVVETTSGALAVEFDINKLQGAEYFPYLSYERRASFTALRIGEAAPYSVLVVYDEVSNSYSTCLVLTSACKEVDFRDSEETLKTGYLTSDVTLYKFPYLTELLTVARLQQGHTVKVLGKVENLDYPYYYVEYTDGETTLRGYVPQSFVCAFDGAPPQTETVIYGGTANNNDSVWRLAYLVLGSAAICILVDILLLKKKKEN